ncbi:ankyrin repeat domain-containing protein [Paraburkholderia bonniea]|uniref:ankyrin repeat domain-containing protein n=1 Tax=Paraburkholderia bonniea TaxID=2152891 RepID=UPI001291BDCC|nr:ankyrin repeat domain-containing protein [Paraburkholderia bonniea]WJF89059.1 ankyrin repeat domain-containing protein [Paraburkholderia bonniea]WJF92375.1 ankyrin repeat domain-containing protein [Paraburkholderia bonniea]
MFLKKNLSISLARLASRSRVASGASSLRRNAARLALAGGLGWAALVAQPVQAAPIDTLVKAVKFDDVKEVNKQLAQGMDPNQSDSEGMPLLVLAAREKSGKVAAALLANSKTNPEIVDRAGQNALMLAALNGDLPLVQLLLAKDAEVNKKGWTPLHYAAANGHDAIVKLLLEHSAYIDAGSPNGTTPLMMAARGGHMSTATLLLDSGADIRVKNQIGLTALDFAKQYKEPDTIKGLTERLQQTAAAPAKAAQ